MPFGVGHWWIILALVVILIIFGPSKLPELAGSVGKAIREFRKTSSEIRDEVMKSNETAASTTVAGPATTATVTPEPPAHREGESKS